MKSLHAIAYDMDKPPSLPLGPVLMIMLMLATVGVRSGSWVHGLWFGAGAGVGALLTMHLFAWRWWRRRQQRKEPSDGNQS